LKLVATELDYSLQTFTATDSGTSISCGGTPIYHTNVMLAIGDGWAICCTDAIADSKERERIVTSLQQTGHTIIDITRSQMAQFAGNALQLYANTSAAAASADSKKTNTTAASPLASHKLTPVCVMSSTAYQALTPTQRTAIGVPIIHVPVPTIEKGGGSVRCMIAEIFCPPK
jgi:hypothetical protein